MPDTVATRETRSGHYGEFGDLSVHYKRDKAPFSAQDASEMATDVKTNFSGSARKL